MKKYIALFIALLAITGCGSKSEGDVETTATETEVTTEETTENNEETSQLENEVSTELQTLNEAENNEDVDNKTNDKNTANNDNFENNKAYSELKSLAENAGFDISYSNGNVVYKTYITDDTIDYIKEKDTEYHLRWDENCGLYEEFCSEAIRTLSNNNIVGVNIVFEVVGSSDNQVYFKNENGTSIYDAYIE